MLKSASKLPTRSVDEPLFAVGVVASIVSGLVGGGSGLILTPAQVLLGIDPKIATATKHFGFINDYSRQAA